MEERQRSENATQRRLRVGRRSKERRERTGGTNDLSEDLRKDPDQLVVHELTALQTGFLESLDLLLDDDLEGCCSDEQRRRGSLQKERGNEGVASASKELDETRVESERKGKGLTEELYKIVLISPSLT